MCIRDRSGRPSLPGVPGTRPGRPGRTRRSPPALRGRTRAGRRRAPRAFRWSRHPRGRPGSCRRLVGRACSRANNRSLANTLFRRDGGTIQAYLVDAETSETHAALSDGQRAYDLEVLVENVAFGLADLAAFQGHPEAMDDQIVAAESVRHRYTALWQELHDQVEIQAGDRFAIQAHIRCLLYTSPSPRD